MMEPRTDAHAHADGETYSPLLELTKARMREFFREKGIVFWVFGFPLLLTIGLGLAFRERPAERPKVAVVGSCDSRLGTALTQSKAIDASCKNATEADADLAHTRVALVVDLSGREPEFRYDPQLPTAQLTLLLSENEIQAAAGRKDAVDIEAVPQTIPGRRYIDFLIPGLLGLNVMGTSLWSIGYNLVVARKRKLLRRYAVTAMRKSHLLLSYFIARAAFLWLELTVLVAFAALAFGTFVQGSYLALIVLSVMGAAAFAGLGLMVGSRGESTEVAQGWLNFAQLPMWILAGVFFSNEGFPAWLQPLIKALPLTALVDGLRAIFNDGAGLFDVWAQLALLLLWAVVAFTLAGRRFRWQ
jgi:ABC-type multidrug transport system permease subunit